MSFSVTLSVRDDISANVRRFTQQIQGAALSEAIGRRALTLTKDHLGKIAETRHDTARRLGANPSGHWAQAVDKTTLATTATTAVISISQPGISRVARDIEILPGAGKQYLTIPMAAESYNQRAYRFKDKGSFFLRSADGSHLFLAQPDGPSGIKLLYSLVRSVRQKQDRSLLPSDAEYKVVVELGALDAVAFARERAGGGRQP